MRPLRITLITIGIFQLILGGLFLFAPTAAPALFGLTPDAPDWANWLFAMMAARFLGYAYGMFAAARHPEQNRPWIHTMIAIQAIDWTATIGYLLAGKLTFGQVTTAAFMPILFIVALLWLRPRAKA